MSREKDVNNGFPPELDIKITPERLEEVKRKLDETKECYGFTEEEFAQVKLAAFTLLNDSFEMYKVLQRKEPTFNVLKPVIENSDAYFGYLSRIFAELYQVNKDKTNKSNIDNNDGEVSDNPQQGRSSSPR